LQYITASYWRKLVGGIVGKGLIQQKRMCCGEHCTLPAIFVVLGCEVVDGREGQRFSGEEHRSRASKVIFAEFQREWEAFWCIVLEKGRPSDLGESMGVQ